MVEGTGLENRQGLTPFVGSNPTLSAIKSWSVQPPLGFQGMKRPLSTILSTIYLTQGHDLKPARVKKGRGRCLVQLRQAGGSR